MSAQLTRAMQVVLKDPSVVGPAVNYHLSCFGRKPVFGVTDQVRHKPGCTAIEYGYRLENSDLGSRGIVPSM